MKPFPKSEDYALDSMIAYERTEAEADYERVRADWYESEVVPLLMEGREALGNYSCCMTDEWLANCDAVLAELEGKT